MTIAIFIVVLTIVAGLVAAAGDRMGQLAAKRKIRIGKLRPRDASRLVAVLTGMAISIVTFGVVFAVWKDFREALTRYTETKNSLASVLAERDGMLDEINEAKSGRDAAIKAQLDAEEKTESAQNMLLAVEDQLSVADAQIKAKETEISEKQEEVDKIQAELASARQEMKDIARIKEGDEIQLEALRKLKNQAVADIGRLNDEIEDLKGSKVLLELGKVLLYHEVPAGTDNLSASIQDAIDRIQINMLRRKPALRIDPESIVAANRFASEFTVGSSGSVVIVRLARNVFENDDTGVLLDFSGLTLSPIVRSGSDFLTIRVNENNSQVFVMGGSSPELTLGSTIDLQFAKRLDTFFQQAALEAGFLPVIQSGLVATPSLNDLINQADDLNARDRPYEIHIRAPRNMTAIDGAKGQAEDAIGGLEELQIIVTGAS